MNSRIFLAAAGFAAWMMLVCPSRATGLRVITREGGGHNHLAASATISGNAILIRVSHLAPGGLHEPGEHLHVSVVGNGSRADVVRGIAPRSPRARLRQSRAPLLVTVPITSGMAVREVRVFCVPGPHATCRS